MAARPEEDGVNGHGRETPGPEPRVRAAEAGGTTRVPQERSRPLGIAISGTLRHHAPTWAGAVLLAILYAACAMRYSGQHFFTGRVFFDLLDAQAVLGIMAVGMTFVIISGGIDLAVGAVMATSSVVIGVLITEHHWPAWAAIGATSAIGAAFGAAQGALIQFTGLRAFIVTLAGMFLARGLGYMLHLESIAIDDPGHARLAGLRISFGELGALRIGAMVMLGAVGLGAYAATFTRFGRAVFALGGSEEAAVLMGLPVARTRVGVYALSGLCSAAAGAVLTLQLSSGSHLEGIGRELDAIAAVVIGGTLLTGGSGSVIGTLVGTLIIGVVITAVTTYEGTFSSGATRVVVAGLLLGFVILQKGLARTVRR
jgi:galactofuranose transport system permease protein